MKTGWKFLMTGLGVLVVAGNALAYEYVGVGYQPYVKQWAGSPGSATVGAFNSYGSGDASVKRQLEVLSPHFNKLATYSAGYAGYYQPTTPWNQVDSNWRVGIEAGNANQRAGRLAFTVAQGIFQQSTTALQDAEIDGAFTIAQNANASFAGTVDRLIFTNEYMFDTANTNAVLAMLQANKTRAQNAGLAIGVRDNNWGILAGGASAHKTALENVVRESDFIMLNLYPSATAVTQGVAASVTEVATQYHAIRTAALALNSNVEVLIGETGWPSQGKAFNDQTGTHINLTNAENYFNQFAQWATDNQVESYYFEGIDEPWKSNQNQSGGNVWTGPDGAEGHYGLFTYSGTGDTGSFTSKFSLAQNYDRVPEPTTLGLLAAGALVWMRRRPRTAGRVQSV